MTTLNGGPGADALNGGPGADTASYADSSVGVLVRLHDASAVRFGDAEGDTLTGIEHLVGSRHNDTLAGDGGDNRLEGGDGNDVCTAALPAETTLCMGVMAMTRYSAARETIP